MIIQFILNLTKDVIGYAQLCDYNKSTLHVFIIFIVRGVSNDDVHGLNPSTSNYNVIYIYIYSFYAKKISNVMLMHLSFKFLFIYLL